jgi:hypothetical protein
MRILLALIISLGWGLGLGTTHAQEPSLAPDDLDFTRDITQRFHFAVWVSLELKEGQFTRYQYDHYPVGGSNHGVERIKADEGVFARRIDGPWLKSDDWADTGTPVSQDLTNELNMYVEVVNAELAKPEDHDSSQGNAVWKFIRQEKKNDLTSYTYERTREHPRPNGVYPQYTFMKAANDIDGQLFMTGTAGQLRSGDQRIPVSLRMIYLVPLPIGSKLEIFDKDTGKKKLQTTITSKDSGYEITTQQSAPPASTPPVTPGASAPAGDSSPGPNASTNLTSPPGK